MCYQDVLTAYFLHHFKICEIKSVRKMEKIKDTIQIFQK